ncbi:MAG: SDR family oxidoreductase [Alphaproteobacteria bacterium]|nr:SDR family oxidoreductase [Alphaproteobacteria bacterium]
MKLDNRAIIITGGASGIGRATARLAASRGASIVVADIDGEGAARAAQEIVESGGKAVSCRTDITSESDVEAMVALAVDTFGRLDGALNNAGLQGRYIPLITMKLEEWQRMIDVNLTGTFLCMKHEIAYMLEHGGGSVVNISSGAGLVGVRGIPDYVASKHGVIGLTRAAAADYSAQGVLVNAICPGAVDTPMLQEAIRTSPPPSSATGGRPIGRYGTAEEIAEGAAWLFSSAASYATGAAFAIDGGYTCV